uniref:Sarcolemma associated protein b n=1 Tax=Poecilia reticulata TaxID=8081 RepID=A0A3P9PNA9_POERE
MDQKELSDPLNSVSLIKDDLTKSNMGSSGEAEKMIQRLNDELREAREIANTEKQKCMELQGVLEEEKKGHKQQAEQSSKQIKHLQGQLQQLQDEVDVLREQINVSSGSHDDLQRAQDEMKSLKRALEAASAERDRDVTAVQSNLVTASKDLDKWRQTASKYEREIEDLRRDLDQQRFLARAVIQTALQSMQMECNGLQKECSVLRSDKQDMVNKHQKEKNSLQSEYASLRAEKEEIVKAHQKEKASVLRGQNTDLNSKLKVLEESQQELERNLVAAQLQHQQDNSKLQTQLDEAESRSKALQKEHEEAQMELSDLKERYEKTEQEKQTLTDQLEEFKAGMKDLQEKGSNVSTDPWSMSYSLYVTDNTLM